MMQWAIEQLPGVHLDTNNLRADAHRFYESLGFKPTHTGMKLSID